MFSYEIFVDHGETPNRCTILPLAYRTDFTILRKNFVNPLQSEVLLHPDGLSLHELHRSLIGVRSVAAIDCVWRRLDPLLKSLPGPEPVKARISEGFVTAYPRVARNNADPEGGFATIEALFIAAAFLEEWDLSLLREYYFAEDFLKRNAEAFRSYGIDTRIESPVYRPLLARNSQTRRISRGRGEVGEGLNKIPRI